jgi:Ala-tRNA(Pro) deacylase
MDIFRFLEENGIAYERCDHPAVFTCEEAERLVPAMEGAKTKNLFVRDKKGRRHFLVVVGYEKIVDLKSLSSLMDLSSMSMASPDRLKRYLAVDPGSVTILAVINDTEKKVEVVFDRALWHSLIWHYSRCCYGTIHNQTYCSLRLLMLCLSDLFQKESRCVGDENAIAETHECPDDYVLSFESVSGFFDLSKTKN